MDKKPESKRLFVYLAFVFGFTWIIFLAYVLSGNIWAADGEISGMDQFVCLGMLVPALAALFARYVTKEGFAVTGKDSLLLGICLKDRKWISFAAFGEEAGWRGDIIPKMINLWSFKKAVVIGGIIWEMWHWPLTYAGHNFGRDYFGYPFTGFAVMCIMCVYGHDTYLCNIPVRFHMACINPSRSK